MHKSVSSLREWRRRGGRQCSRKRFLRFFQIPKKRDFLRFLKRAFRKNIKNVTLEISVVQNELTNYPIPTVEAIVSEYKQLLCQLARAAII